MGSGVDREEEKKLSLLLHLLGRQPAEGDDVELPPERLVHRAQLRLLQRSALHVDLLDRRFRAVHRVHVIDPPLHHRLAPRPRQHHTLAVGQLPVGPDRKRVVARR